MKKVIAKNTFSIFDSIKPDLITLLQDSFDNAYTNILDIPTLPGHYCILCDKPVPGKEKETGKIGNKYLWYNGDCSNSLRGRLRRHLFRTKRYTASSAIAVEKITEAEYKANSKGTDHNYFKQEDGYRYLNGIDSNEPQWSDYTFYMAVIVSYNLAGSLETLLREHWHKPVLCQYGKR